MGQEEIIHDVEVTDIADKGKGVGRSNGRILFIERAVPGDIVDVRITKKRKTYAEAHVVEVKSYSGDRTEPFCEHFGVCGGCKWQSLSYPSQLAHKQKMVHDALTRLGGAAEFEMLPILESREVKAYRNRLDYAFCNKKWLNADDFKNRKGWNEGALGFHLPGRFDKVLDIQKCWLQDDLTNGIRNHVRKYAREAGLAFYDYRKHTGYLRSLILRNTEAGEWMAIVVFAYDDDSKRVPMLDDLARAFPQVTSLLYVINPKKNDTIFDLDVHTHKGEPCLFETIDGLRFRISAKSFFQTNTRQARALYHTAIEMAGFNGHENVYDLYTGTGTIACLVSRHCKQVTGIDQVEEAIADAGRNAADNGITNTTFVAGDMRKLFSGDFLLEHGIPDVVMTDPPRAGMEEKVVRRLLETGAGRIVYISCNPATQARDIGWLLEKYQLVRSRPVDMFPHTHHVENVALLRLKEE